MKNKVALILFTVIPLGGIVLATLGVFKFVGVTYKNNLSLFLFLGLYLLIEFVMDNIIEVVATRLNETYWMNFLRVVVALYVTDQVMDSISVGMISLVALGVIFTVIEYLLDRLDDDEVYEEE